MPKFTDEQIERYVEDFLNELPDTPEYQSDRVRGAVFFALSCDQFREEIAEPMEDVKQILIAAELYIQHRIDNEA